VKRILDRDILLNFFMTFARCEFALKTGGFAERGYRKGVGNEAQADWDAFAQAISSSFQAGLEPETKAACARLIEARPWELVLINGNVMWQQQTRRARETLAENALAAVKRLRNNLFHGNEASGVQGYTTEQTEQLLCDAVMVLQASVILRPAVQAAYDGASL
jgi:hypothetical protein